MMMICGLSAASKPERYGATAGSARAGSGSTIQSRGTLPLVRNSVSSCRCSTVGRLVSLTITTQRSPGTGVGSGVGGTGGFGLSPVTVTCLLSGVKRLASQSTTIAVSTYSPGAATQNKALPCTTRLGSVSSSAVGRNAAEAELEMPVTANQVGLPAGVSSG